MKKTACFLILATALSACSSATMTPTPENTEDRVVARIDGLSSRPDWLKESEVFTVSKGEVISLGVTSIPGDHRVEAATKIAQNSAKASICGAIESRLSYVFQQAEDGTAMDSTQVRSIGAEACSLTTSAIKPGRVYWERVATTQNSGERTTVYRVFATVTMAEQDLKAAILNAARKRQGKGGLSADFSKKVDAHWNKFVTGDQSSGQSNPLEGGKAE